MLNLFLLFSCTILFIIRSCSCHRGKIVGGRFAQEGEFPFIVWIVSFELKTRKSCGGSIISRLFVISACHCFIDLRTSTHDFKLKRKLELYKVVAGSIDVHNEARIPKIDHIQLSSRTYWKNVRDIDMAIVDPKCQHNEFSLSHDGALLRLKFPLTFSPFISRVPLYSKQADLLRQHLDDLLDEESYCSVLGWGFTKFYLHGSNTFYTQISSILKITTIMLTPDSQCFKFHCYSPCINRTRCCTDNWVEKDVICGLPIFESDACLGDSGGPLICKGYFTGIVSYGKACGERLTPTMYTTIHSIIDTFNSVFENEGFI